MCGVFVRGGNSEHVLCVCVCVFVCGVCLCVCISVRKNLNFVDRREDRDSKVFK